MSTSNSNPGARHPDKVLVVGLGGLGCPAALALAEAGVDRLVLADDDCVQRSNLHRQILFEEEDVGRDKLEAARSALERRNPDTRIELVHSRLLPENARDLARKADVVIEGADNYATKFLTADAGVLAGIPVVHGAAIRWNATVWAVSGTGGPCYRCLFEDLPEGGAQMSCGEAGVMGPVVGLAGAMMADCALRVLEGDGSVYGSIRTYDGKTDRLRAVEVPPRRSCPLCGDTPTIVDIDASRYTGETCAA